ncbi:MAG: sterol desaturase family protein [Myxococcales bacterium]|nr:sterol desaturase family protein [Myxococcales bacterium]
MTRLETTGYYALGVPFYLVMLGAEWLLARRRGLKVFRLAEAIGNVSAGVGELVVGLFWGPVVIALYDFGYDRCALVRWPEGSWIPWVIAVFGGDFGYYLYHRAGHRVAAFWAIHGVHHQAEEMNVTVAMRHPWLSDTYAVVFYAWLPLVGVPPLQFFVAISLISFYALTVHSRFFHRPSFGFLVTPRTHIVHHAKNPRYLDKNFGAMFTIWDRLFGTYVEVDPADPPRLGSLRGYETHDGVRSQWVWFRDLVVRARAAKRPLDALKVFVMPPGWLPEGVTDEPITPARADAEIPARARAYVVVQFVLTLAFAVWVIALRGARSPGEQAVFALVIVAGLLSLGGILDGRRSARAVEVGRLAASAIALGLVAAGRLG